MTVELRRLGAPLTLLAAALLLGLAAWSAPPALDAVRLMAHRTDPVAVADAGLDQVLTPQRFAEGLDRALAAGDVDLAQSFIELGRTRGLAATPDQTASLVNLRATAKEKAAEEFVDGFLHGERESSAAFAGALTGDIIGYGDLRDLWHEGEKLHRGETADTLVVGLAAAGLALSVATWSSVGAILNRRVRA